jgi:hypothetical protein
LQLGLKVPPVVEAEERHRVLDIRARLGSRELEDSSTAKQAITRFGFECRTNDPKRGGRCV